LDIIPEILDKVFLRDKDDALFQKLGKWANEYSDKHPNVSPRKMQNSATQDLLLPRSS
jgi:hypothetical protein